MYPHLMRAGLLAGLAGLLIACSGETAKNDGFTVSGSVGNGSLVGAAVTVADANGEVIIEALSDEATHYEAQIPPETALPLTLTAKGGVDLVTGTANAFELMAVAFSTSETANVSPLTTLAARIAECSGDTSESSMDVSWSLIQTELAMGLNAAINPMTQPISTGNAAELVLANEALREALHRVLAALAGSGADTSADEILAQIACDLEQDGVLDGVGQGADARTTATFHAAQAGVLLEVIAGGLHIDGQNATTVLDLAIEAILGSSGVSVRDVVITDALVEQARAALALFLVQLPDDEIFDLMVLLGGVDATAVAVDIAAALDAAHQTVLWGIADRIALADSSEISALASRMSQQNAASPPMISLAASATMVANGSSTTLSWASAQADRCTAADGWDGAVGLNGSFTTAGLTHTTDFVLECVGLGGTSTATVQVVVTNPDPAAATILSVQNATIDAGNATTLSWSSTNADQCQASGAWTGSRPTAGSESTGALNSTRTYTLTCSGSGGSDAASVTVAVNAPPPPIPTVSLSAANQQVNSGASTTLTWSSTNTTGCVASGGWSGTKATGGNQLVGPLNANTTFTLTCTGAGGSASATATVQVNAAPAPTVSLGAANQQVNSGASTTLTWSSTNTTGCTASGGWSGTKATVGNQLVGPLNANTTFTLTCTGAGGSASATATVQVNAAPAPTVSLGAANQQVNSGASTTLTWSSTNTTGCTASGGWSGTKATVGNQLVGPLNANTTFTLTCTGAGGSASATATVQVNAAPAPSVSLSAANQLVNSGGSTTLTWSSTNATSCTASGGWGGTKTTGGNQLVGPLNANTTFTLTCSGSGGNAVAMITVNVTGTLNLTWVAPTQNVDGSALTDLAGYKIYYGDSSRNYLSPAAVNSATATSFSITLPSGSYYVTMTAVDADGNESAYSNEVFKSTN